METAGFIQELFSCTTEDLRITYTTFLERISNKSKADLLSRIKIKLSKENNLPLDTTLLIGGTLKYLGYTYAELVNYFSFYPTGMMLPGKILNWSCLS